MRKRAGQSGFTLVELSVTMLILSLVVTAATASFISSNRTASVVDNRIENLGQAQILMRNATKDLRTATPTNSGNNPAIIIGTPWDITFYAYLNTTSASPTATVYPNKVRLYVDTTNPTNPTLHEQVWTPTDTTVDPPLYGGAAKDRFVGQFVTNTPASGIPAFEYYDNSSPAPLPIVPAGPSSPTGTTLTDTQRGQVYAIKISLRVRKSNLPAVKGTLLTNRVRLPNVIYTPKPGT